ncbi:MAG: AAA family ATPase, partial [Oscillospiraceae bacterium]|nr:AAA family ATPase [Oscillospiraceae bacterium]
EAFQDIYYLNQQRRNGRTPLRLNMAFVGNPGTGKTTVARMMADMLCNMGLIRKNKLVEAKPADLISPWVGQTAIQTRDICRSAYDGVLLIDEAYALTPFSENYAGSGSSGSSTAQCVNTLLQEMEENGDRLVVIFAGYPGPIDRFFDSNPGLRSRITKVIQFPDYTEEELLQIFEGICVRERFSVTGDGYEALKARISFEKNGESFGNARSMENMFQSIRAEWQKGPDREQLFTPRHIRAAMPEQHRSSIGEMIGLGEIKEQLEQFESRVRYIKAVGEKGVQAPPMNLHMLFTGNPGTGKTSVAQVIAEDLYQIGVLKTNKCICVEARDLIGNWSDAAKRTEKEIQRAMGGVLFLDEAYALTEYASREVGREVVATLITAMEKHRGELLVIAAGYPSNMRAFLKVNPGLASRIGYTFHFRDYTAQELTDIFLSKMRKYGYLLSDGVAEKVAEGVTAGDVFNTLNTNGAVI